MGFTAQVRMRRPAREPVALPRGCAFIRFLRILWKKPLTTTRVEHARRETQAQRGFRGLMRVFCLFSSIKVSIF